MECIKKIFSIASAAMLTACLFSETIYAVSWIWFYDRPVTRRFMIDMDDDVLEHLDRLFINNHERLMNNHEKSMRFLKSAIAFDQVNDTPFNSGGITIQQVKDTNTVELFFPAEKPFDKATQEGDRLVVTGPDYSFVVDVEKKVAVKQTSVKVQSTCVRHEKSVDGISTQSYKRVVCNVFNGISEAAPTCVFDENRKGVVVTYVLNDEKNSSQHSSSTLPNVSSAEPESKVLDGESAQKKEN